MADQLTETSPALKALQQDMVTFELDYAAHYQKAQADDARDDFKAVQSQQIEQTPVSVQGQQQDMTQAGAAEDGPGIGGKVARDVTLGVIMLGGAYYRSRGSIDQFASFADGGAVSVTGLSGMVKQLLGINRPQVA